MNALVVTEPPALPAAYAVFLPVFERLSGPMQLVLRGLLDQFETLARSHDIPRLAAQGEFEGMGGLARHGEIGHILQSELLLRTEAPLEFLRRLADSETLYLERQYADPGVRQVYRAIVSVGPGLLGHGRVLALAALFYLARMALARGAQFHWTFLPREGGPVWFEGLEVNSVKRLLKAASFRELAAEDHAEALNSWSGLTGETAETTDWVIGARPRHAAERPAIETAANALAFELLPAGEADQRPARLFLRFRDRERAAVEMLFPDDAVCVSALIDPFRPMAPAQVPALGKGRPGREGWAPTRFSSPGSQRKIVRLRDGLLILDFEQESELQRVWFAPLARDVLLAGVRVQSSMLQILVYKEAQEAGTLCYATFYLRGAKPTMTQRRRHRVTAGQLFRNFSPHAIPPLSASNNVRFHSSSGQAYDLSLGLNDAGVKFEPQYKAARILGSDGLYDVLSEETSDRLLKVRKNGLTGVSDFLVEDADLTGDGLKGLVYSRSEQGLAFSTAPGRWTVAAPARTSHPSKMPEAQTLTLARHEVLLSARLQHDSAIVRVWSDARHGGEGTIRTLRVRDDTLSKPQSVYKLGEDAFNLVKLEPGNSGFWGLTVDELGLPARLIHYRPNRGANVLKQTAFAIEDLIRDAYPIDMGAVHG